MNSKTFLTLSCQGAHMLDQCKKEFFAMSDERKVTCMLDEDQFLFGALTMLKYCTATDVGVAISSFPCITKKGSPDLSRTNISGKQFGTTLHHTDQRYQACADSWVLLIRCRVFGLI